ncbi:MAG: T9SS type A sorting domain-containing protein [Saprospiraceae bacterium]|nr:T9SS type A sorting domain-containing protein [Saprospiraceae bacterium]
MKFKNIYTVAALLGLFILLQSKSGGPATQLGLRVSGAPGDGTCANTGCHTAGSFDPSLSVQLLEGDNPVTKYDPGKTYTLRVAITPGDGNPARHGFQAVALDASNAQAGDWDGSLPAGVTTKIVASRSYIEHSSPKTANFFEVPWVAPAAGTGKVTFYSAGLAANNNSQVSGDGMAASKITIDENTTSNTLDIGQALARMEVLPNPVSDMLNLRITSRTAGEHKLRIFDAAGNVVKMAPTSLQVGQNTASVPVGELAAGLYLVQLCGNGHLAAVQMVKL